MTATRRLLKAKEVRESYRVANARGLGYTTLTIYTDRTARFDFHLQDKKGNEQNTWSAVQPSEGMAWLEECRQDRTLMITKLV